MASDQNTDLFAHRIPKVHASEANRSIYHFNAGADLETIIKTANENAPYLAGLVEKWPNIIDLLRTKSPEKIYQELLNTPAPDIGYEELKREIRHQKQQVHLLCALCDLAGVWTWHKVTEAMSDFADHVMALLINAVAAEMGFKPDRDRGPVPGLFVLALGKYGARELNYSSDIDLIVFYDPDYLKLPDMNRAERLLIRFIKKLMRGFDEITHDGYVFRTDLRLRPDPRSNSVAVSTITAERYYETLGQNWERAAMIKARYCGGDPLAADDFVKNILTPFIWRRSLDYAAISDIHSIKRQIQGEAKPEDISAPGHDLKLGIGGIREIEFYAQVQQLILGGRHKQLRCPRTVDALEQLADASYVDRETAVQLTDDYALLRGLEHRIQMFKDEQTHIWPDDKNDRLNMLALHGGENLLGLESELEDIFTRIHTTYTNLFPGEEDLSSPLGSLVFTGVEPEGPTLETLSKYGFVRGSEVWRQMADWLGGRIRATRTPRARELLTNLAPRIIDYCGTTNEPDLAFFTFADFLTKLNAGVTLFSMFESKPEALKELIQILVLAPPLSQILSDQPSLIDAMIEPDFLMQKGSQDRQVYLRLIDDRGDFEAAMNIVRRAVHEDQFSLTAGLLKTQNLQKAGVRFTEIAIAAIHALMPVAVTETERLFGPISGQFAILGFGKLGGREMSLGSDLDIVLVYQKDAKSAETHEKQVDKFNKLTRRIITALSTTTEAGTLYEVDMALRPSGRSGPLAVDLPIFEKYYHENAWTWEFMALSRARVVYATSPEFEDYVTQTVGQIVTAKDFETKLAADIVDMHTRLARDKPSKGFWDLKGKLGGLRDIEFIAQYLVLKHKFNSEEKSTLSMLSTARDLSYLSAEDAAQLLRITDHYHALVQVLNLSASGLYVSERFSHSFKKLLCETSASSTFQVLEAALAKDAEIVSEIFEKIIVEEI
ncbi:MAG: bifunctional [glutamine synthetase] adenylyltransferase/[glutamine synthetase]-adenylyl-L-tyrosine phosphorylase [Hyphomonadaceae bacterium]|nr:bifunctional [glutamine synthetase] adenylyltransferase/[glutamine synthetase]-adenylyl-L-tyrosine phosphorylase [Hyphomonadaceae bacterium]